MADPLLQGHACPVCWTPLAGRVCDACGSPVEVGEHGLRHSRQEIIPGTSLVQLDFSTQALPGCQARDASVGSCQARGVEHGVEISVPPGKTVTFSEPDVRIRNLCLRAHVLAIDSACCLGLICREELIGDGGIGYVFDVSWQRGAVRLARRCEIGTAAQLQDLLPWTQCTALLPPGAWNLLEVRVQGSELQGWINGQCVGSVFDPAYGIGRTGLRALSEAATATSVQRAVVANFALNAVAE